METFPSDVPDSPGRLEARRKLLQPDSVITSLRDGQLSDEDNGDEHGREAYKQQKPTPCPCRDR